MLPHVLMLLGFAAGEAVQTRYVIIGPIQGFGERVQVSSPPNRVQIDAPNARAFTVMPEVDE